MGDRIHLMLMDSRYTRHQIPRGARADAETNDRIVLVKNVPLLRATYQIRLLAFRALGDSQEALHAQRTLSGNHPSGAANHFGAAHCEASESLSA